MDMSRLSRMTNGAFLRVTGAKVITPAPRRKQNRVVVVVALLPGSDPAAGRLPDVDPGQFDRHRPFHGDLARHPDRRPERAEVASRTSLKRAPSALVDPSASPSTRRHRSGPVDGPGVGRGEGVRGRAHPRSGLDLRSGRVNGFEALPRWGPSPTRHGAPAGLHPSPTGLIVPIGTWVPQEACRQAADWNRRRPATKLLSKSVNLSARQLQQPDLPQLVAEVLASTISGRLSLC